MLCPGIGCALATPLSKRIGSGDIQLIGFTNFEIVQVLFK